MQRLRTLGGQLENLSARPPPTDPDYAADALLAALSAELVAHLRRDYEMPLERMADGFEGLIRGLVRGANPSAAVGPGHR